MKLTIRRVRHNLTDPIVVPSNEWGLSLFGHCEEYDDQPENLSETAIMVDHRKPFSLVGRLPGCRYRYATPALEIILST